MNHAKHRFTLQLDKIKALLAQAEQQENPALWLYLSDLRTPMFQIQGLARLYADLYNAKTFNKIKDKSKRLEDALGAADYYIAYYKAFAPLASIPEKVKQHIEAQAHEKVFMLHQTLLYDGWLGGEAVKKIEKKLKAVDWFKGKKAQKQEVAVIAKHYDEEIKALEPFFIRAVAGFTDIELDVHELRRKLRWLSIYAQALNGVVRLDPTEPPLELSLELAPEPEQEENQGVEHKTAKKPPPKLLQNPLQKYLTLSIRNSPYNQLQIKPQLKHHLALSQDHFLALSWIIAELGHIKDQGLRLRAVTVAIQATEFIKTEEAEKRALEVLGKDQAPMPALLQKASELSKAFFEDGVLRGLVRSM